MTDGSEHELLVATLVEDLWDRSPDAWTGEDSYHAFTVAVRDTIEDVLLDHPSFDDALPVIIDRVGCQRHPVPLYGPTNPLPHREEQHGSQG